jgi:hypothetical protein
MSLQDPLILLVGMPRSGTTWIGKIFDSHPDTLYRHEPDSAEPIPELPVTPAVDDWQRYRQSVRSFADWLPAMRATKVAGSLPTFSKSYMSRSTAYSQRVAIMVTKLAARAFGECGVPRFVRYERIPQLRIVWKSIESTGRLGVLVRSITTRSILILRHPCGYVASVLRGEAQRKFGDTACSSEDYGILEMLLDTQPARVCGLTMAALRVAEPVERLAWQWRLFNDKALAEIQGRKDVLVIRYEDLCAAPVKQVENLFRFAGLSWAGQTERFLAASTSARRSGYYSVFKDPREAAWGWRRELPQAMIDRILGVTGAGTAGRMYGSDRSEWDPGRAEAVHHK